MRARDKRTATKNVRSRCFIIHEKTKKKTSEGGATTHPPPPLLLPFYEVVAAYNSFSRRVTRFTRTKGRSSSTTFPRVPLGLQKGTESASSHQLLFK